MTVSEISALQAINGMFSAGKTRYVPQFAAKNEGVAVSFGNGEYDLNRPRHDGLESPLAKKLDYSA